MRTQIQWCVGQIYLDRRKGLTIDLGVTCPLINLTTNVLGRLPVILTLSLSLSIISPHAYVITLFQRVRVYRAPEVSRIRSETQFRAKLEHRWYFGRRERKGVSTTDVCCANDRCLCYKHRCLFCKHLPCFCTVVENIWFFEPLRVWGCSPRYGLTNGILSEVVRRNSRE